MHHRSIQSPEDPQLDQLCAQLRDLAPELENAGAWPAEQLRLCASYGVFRWFLPTEFGGEAWSDRDVVRGYLKLSAACLTTTFIITQYTGACRRIASCSNTSLQSRLLPRFAEGELFVTLGISHLTTSRRHLQRPVLRARSSSRGGFVLDGTAPWVTGAVHADYILLGATLEDGLEILTCLPTELAGVSAASPEKLVGLNASQTGPLELQNCLVGGEFLVAGPVEGVMKQQGVGTSTGGLQTSTLAAGLATAAVEYMGAEAQRRDDLVDVKNALSQEVEELREDVLRIADGEPICSNEVLRSRANSLALRCAQAALAAAKGTGYVCGHPAGRWCREALFFLVWSCPQPVMAANLCELAGISD